jgi:cyclase
MLAIALVAAHRAAAQQDFSKVEVTVVPVRGGIYMLQGAGGNIGLCVGADSPFLIDDQYAPLTPKIRAAIATVTQQPVRFLMNTHWHGDHTGVNANMASVGAILVAHENVRRRMSTEQFVEAIKQRVAPSPTGALPVITFSDSISFFLNGDTIRAAHVKNAHTDGDAVITFRAANVVHMGDTFFNGMYPLIDLSSGGSLDGMIAAVAMVLATTDADTRYIPGHGPLATRADLQRYHDMLAGVRGRLTELAARKQTVEQVLAAKPLADYDAAWGNGFMKPDVFLTIAYTSVTHGPTTNMTAPHGH